MNTVNKTEGFFLLVQRGGCSFHTKIKNAEKFGAEVIIIADFNENQNDVDEEDEEAEEREFN